MKTAFLIHIMLLCFTQIAYSQTKTIKGIIVDNSTDSPVNNSLVVILQKDKIIASQVTGNSGEFIFNNIGSERFTLNIRAQGYKELLQGPFSMAGTDTFRMKVQMEKDETYADETGSQPDENTVIYGTPVSGERLMEARTLKHLAERGFFKRMQDGWGRYLSPDDLRDKSYSSMAHLLAQIPGLVFDYRSFDAEGYPYRSLTSGAGKTPGLQVYLDGLSLDEPVRINNFNPNDIAAVEFYSSRVSAPAQFINPWKTGGVLLLWTKK